MRKCKDEQSRLREVETGRRDYNKLADAWDKTVLRTGDQAMRQTNDDTASHPNRITHEGVIKTAFMSVGVAGPARSLQSGVSGTHRQHEICCSVAEACRNALIHRTDTALYKA